MQQVIVKVLRCFSLNWLNLSLPEVVWGKRNFPSSSSRRSSSLQICVFSRQPGPFGSSCPPPSSSTNTAASPSGDIWMKFAKLLERVREKYSSPVPAELQPHWLGFVCWRPTIVFGLNLAKWQAHSQWEWYISSSASIRAACCDWSQAPLCRDLSSRLPKRGDWIHLLTNEVVLQILHFPSHGWNLLKPFAYYRNQIQRSHVVTIKALFVTSSAAFVPFWLKPFSPLLFLSACVSEAQSCLFTAKWAAQFESCATCVFVTLSF